MKLKKSPIPYVFVFKNCSGRRAIIVFVSTGTYDHEEVFTSLLYHCHTSIKKFLRHTKSSEVTQKILTFCTILRNLCSGSGLKGYETEKNIIGLRLCK